MIPCCSVARSSNKQKIVVRIENWWFRLPLLRNDRSPAIAEGEYLMLWSVRELLWSVVSLPVCLRPFSYVHSRRDPPIHEWCMFVPERLVWSRRCPMDGQIEESPVCRTRLISALSDSSTVEISHPAVWCRICVVPRDTRHCRNQRRAVFEQFEVRQWDMETQ